MTERKKDPAAVALGRKGGEKKVRKGFGVLSEEERIEKAKAGAAARWGDPATRKKKAAAKKAVKKADK